MRIRILLCAVVLAAAAGVEAAVIDVTAAPYSANGNDALDDTTAIQNALNAVPASGGTVYVPAGVYIISDVLKIKSKTTFRGDGPRASQIQMGTNGNDDILENSDQVNGNDGIVIEDLELNGNKTNQSVLNMVMGIDLLKVTDFVVQRVYVHDCVRDGIHVYGDSRRGKILDNTVRNNGKTGAIGGNGIGIPNGVDIIISRNLVTENMLSGIDMEKSNPSWNADEIERILISDNHIISNAEIGISSEGEPANPSRSITITGNHIISNLEGIRIEDTRGYVVSNNTIKSTPTNGIVITGDESIDGTITGNHIYDVGSASPGNYDGIYIDSTQQRITITGNNIQGVGVLGVQHMRRAINAPSATNLTIVANTGRGGADPTQIYAPAVTNLVSTNKTN
ncbi:MAG TPA: glycosyl hydrolase family 28-related protein [Thermoanaerobaculia bacterium]